METATRVSASATNGGIVAPMDPSLSHSQANPAAAAGSVAPSSPSPAPASDVGANSGGGEVPVNPRKRKKASRACDFCHVNHQPCDNGKPRCSVCAKHNKPCLYLRPTKRRGPQKGYRTALNTYKESAAAWGAVLAAIPGLDALIEGHLRGSAGKTIVASIKDASQQEALISRWQQSSVFKAFFGQADSSAKAAADSALLSQEAEDDEMADDTPPAPPPPPPKKIVSSQAAKDRTPSSVVAEPRTPSTVMQDSPLQPRDTLSDIVAKDAAQAAMRTSQTLASLGFAPDETIADFYSMGSNPDPLPDANDPDFDPALGTESEQRAYYELLMGRSFP